MFSGIAQCVCVTVRQIKTLQIKSSLLEKSMPKRSYGELCPKKGGGGWYCVRSGGKPLGPGCVTVDRSTWRAWGVMSRPRPRQRPHGLFCVSSRLATSGERLRCHGGPPAEQWTPEEPSGAGDRRDPQLQIEETPVTRVPFSLSPPAEVLRYGWGSTSL